MKSKIFSTVRLSGSGQEFHKSDSNIVSKKIQNILTILLFTLIVSCSKDDNAFAPNTSEAVYRIMKTEFASGLSSTFEYDTQNRITNITSSDGSFEKYNYNSQGQIISYEQGGQSNPFYNSITNYFYNQSAIKIEEIKTQSTGEKTKYVYTNNSIGLPTSSNYYLWKTSSSTWIEDLSQNSTYTYNSSNQLIKLEQESQYFLSSYDTRGNLNESKQYNKKADGSYYLNTHLNSTYDDKKGIGNSPFPNKNNMINDGYKTYTQNGTLLSQYAALYSYQYNEAGYVTKQFLNGVLYATYTLEKVE